MSDGLCAWVPRSRQDRRVTSTTTSRIRDTIRTFNKYVLNPAMLLVAGRSWWYAGVIRHTGRTTGKNYATPVVVNPVEGDGFIIPLPYGTDVDWLRNLMASDKASVTVGGKSFEVCTPTIIDAAAAAPLLSDRRRREFARLGVRQFVRVQRAGRRRPPTARR